MDTTIGALGQFVADARSLYTLPAVATQVLELTNEPKVDATALKNCIEKDPALTVKLLRVVNSSLFGMSREVADLQQAISLLGVKPLKMLVLGFCLPRELFTGVEAEVLRQYWTNSLIKAVAARELSILSESGQDDEAFVCGLLQDLGMLVLIQKLNTSYIEFLQRVDQEDAELVDEEMATIGFDHAELSAKLLDYWKLPQTIVRGINRVESDADYGERDARLRSIVDMAELLTQLLTRNRGRYLQQLIHLAEEKIGFSIDQIRGLVDLLEEKVPPLADVFSITWDQEAYLETVVAAHQLLSQLNEGGISENLGPTAVLSDSTESAALQKSVDHYLRAVTPQEAREQQDEEEADTAIAPQYDEVAVSLDEPGLLGKVETAIGRCRRQRLSLSLLLIQIENFEDLLMVCGPQKSVRLIRELRGDLQSFCGSSLPVVMSSDSVMAVIMSDCDRESAVELARDVLQESTLWQDEAPLSYILSVGVATLAMPPRNFPAQDLIDAAERCLYAASTAGGRVVKSIDL